MMGALGSSYVKLSTSIEFTLKNTKPIMVQGIIDNIAPGLLPLCCIMGIYFTFKKKGQNYNLVLCSILLISLLGSLAGIF
jgi:mannose/fructose/N-acetylgalactosamine-specific phosphotransferase system component IID